MNASLIANTVTFAMMETHVFQGLKFATAIKNASKQQQLKFRSKPHTALMAQ